MTLTGTFERVLDDKKRIAVPKNLREEFSSNGVSHAFVAPGQDRSLAIYSPVAFEQLAQKLAASTASRTDNLNYQRLLYSRAEKVEFDGQGRIRIPDRLVELAQLKSDIVLLGVLDHAEIWDKAIWAEFLNQHTARFDEMAQAAFA